MTLTLILPDGTTRPLGDHVRPIPAAVDSAVQDSIVDYVGQADGLIGTAEHYSLQWGPDLQFAGFLKDNPQAARHMVNAALGWSDLFTRIRERARHEEIAVYDAACGYGGIFTELFAPPYPEHLTYLGADIHRSLATIPRPPQVPADRYGFIRQDIEQPVPVREGFDYVICRSAVHHTRSPRATFASLVGALRPGGTIAISAYARKAPMREAVDDGLRARAIALPVEPAWEAARQIAKLGADLQSSPGEIVITEDLPWLGITAGHYTIQSFIYDYFMKCWYNSEFGEKNSTLVNFDWYHPPYAFRYELAELLDWFAEEGLTVTHRRSVTAQHYLEGIKGQATPTS